MSVSFHENRESTREIAGEADSARKEATPKWGKSSVAGDVKHQHKYGIIEKCQS
jgi:hypothetical protein